MENIHTFTNSGLGQAPFTCTGSIDAGTVAKVCDHCGRGIRFVFNVTSADGKKSSVGSTCIEKSGDEGMIKVVKQELADRRREKAHQTFLKFRGLAWGLRDRIGDFEDTLSQFPSPNKNRPNDTMFDWASFMLNNAGVKGWKLTLKVLSEKGVE